MSKNYTNALLRPPGLMFAQWAVWGKDLSEKYSSEKSNKIDNKVNKKLSAIFPMRLKAKLFPEVLLYLLV